MKPTVLHLTTVPFTLHFLRGHVTCLQQCGFEVRVLSTPGEMLEQFAREHQVSCDGVAMQRRISPIADLAALTKIFRRLRKIRPEIVHAHTPKAGLLGMLAAWLTAVPVRIYHIHGLPLATCHGPKRWLLRRCDRVACRLAHRVICVSQSLRETVLNEGLCHPEKTITLAAGSVSGVDAEAEFNPAGYSVAQREWILAQHGIPRDALVVGFVGRVVPDKGIAELSRAWRSLRTEFPQLHLLIVGPLEAHAPLPSEVRQSLEQDPRVHFTGMVRHTAPYLAAMDVLALPSYREGFGVVAIEASAMERPVVATRIVGCIDAVKDGVTGTLIPVRDATALQAALARYLRTPQLRRRHGQKGRQRVLTSFRPQDVWRATVAEYRRLMKLDSEPDRGDKEPTATAPAKAA